MALSASDVMGWWDFEEGSGTTVADETGSFDCSLANSPLWVTDGPSNLPKGVDFNGTNQYGEVSNDYDPSEGALCVWMKTDTTADFRVVAGNGNGGGEADIFFFGGLLYGRSRFGTGDDQVTTTISVSTLYHVVWAFKSGDMALYVNGSLVGTNTATGTLVDNNNNLFFARRSGSASAYYNGKLYQVVLLNRRPSTAEVGEMYNSGAGITYSGLFGGGGVTPPQFLGYAGL